MAIAILAFLLAACGADVPVPVDSPSPPAALRPLPGNVAGIPGPTDQTALIPAHSRRGELEVGIARNFVLGHCGLMSPIDIDGSLWDPVSGQDAQGGPLTDDQTGELINATPTAIVLIDQNTMELRTPRSAVITLARHDGPRPYFLCD